MSVYHFNYKQGDNRSIHDQPGDWIVYVDSCWGGYVVRVVADTRAEALKKVEHEISTTFHKVQSVESYESWKIKDDEDTKRMKEETFFGINLPIIETKLPSLLNKIKKK